MTIQTRYFRAFAFEDFWLQIQIFEFQSLDSDLKLLKIVKNIYK